MLLCALAMTSSTILNNSNKSEHPCFIPDLREKKIQLFSSQYNVDCEFVIYGHYHVRVYSFYTKSFKHFYHKSKWYLSNVFSVFIEMIM